jgi:hypothetical protein
MVIHITDHTMTLKMQPASRQARMGAHAGPDGARDVAPSGEGMCSRPDAVI